MSQVEYEKARITSGIYVVFVQLYVSIIIRARAPARARNS